MHTERANAKINAYLNITSRRPDGYHDVHSILQTVSLCDLVTVDFSFAPQTHIALSILGNADLPCDSSNLAWRAAECFLQYAHLTGEVCIKIQKHIPTAAGLAGGSADAAAVLRALNALCGEPFTAEDLCRIGLTLGADVPFCIRGGAMLATGVGEVLHRIADMPACTIVVAVGEERISTPKAYAALDEKFDFFQSHSTENPKALELAELWQNDALSASCSCFYNIFEEVVPSENKEVAAVKRLMREGGAICSMMSGSGPAVFGIFEEQQEAERIAAALQEKGFQSFVCHPRGEHI